MKPPLRLTDPSFRYTSAVATDISKRFARIRKELAAVAALQDAAKAKTKQQEATDTASVVLVFEKRRAK